MKPASHVAIVMPCLNEEAVLLRTCKSLGFALGLDSFDNENILLVLVDNDSDDNTVAVMKQVKDSSPPHSVLIVHEKERGFVPPRHTGVRCAKQLLTERGIKESDILILQADADTEYMHGYVDAMLAASITPSGFLEGVAIPEPKFAEAWPEYISLVDKIDGELTAALPSDGLDIIVDDKVCGYRLSDYQTWGGHRRAYDANRDEIHAESSRLFIRALTLGATKVSVPSAIAATSCRRIAENAALFFSTAGFPREVTWIEHWKRVHHAHPQIISDFLKTAGDPVFEMYVADRMIHFVLLFSILPALVFEAIGHKRGEQGALPHIDRLGAESLSFSRSEIERCPSVVFERSFEFARRNESLLKDAIQSLLRSRRH